jgi:hypothetical protein
MSPLSGSDVIISGGGRQKELFGSKVREEKNWLGVLNKCISGVASIKRGRRKPKRRCSQHTRQQQAYGCSQKAASPSRRKVVRGSLSDVGQRHQRVA